MAHEIDVSTGRAAVFVTHKPAWHKLGKVVEQAQTAAAALQLSGQDWRVVQKTVFWRNASGAEMPIPGYKANVRSDTAATLGIVGEGYAPFQNADAFSFFDSVVGEGQAVYETAGVLFGGCKTWIMAKLPKGIRAGKDDEIVPYTLLSNSHDGTQALRMYPTSVRVVCANTLTLAGRLRERGMRKREGDQGIAIRHSGDLKSKVAEAKRALGITIKAMDVHQQEVTALVGRKMNGQESLRYFQSFFPTTVKETAIVPPTGANVLDAILSGQAQQEAVVKDLLSAHYAETERQAKANTEILLKILGNYDNEGNRLPDIAHSAWTCFNAVSEFADYGMKYRGSDNQDDRRLESVWWGRANTLKQKAFDSALALTT